MEVVGDTNILVSCSRCGIQKERCEFIKNRNICKACDNKRNCEKYKLSKCTPVLDKCCINCNITKPTTEFNHCRNLCKECNNLKRREKYNDNEEHRLKLIQMATEFKQKKIAERQRLKEETIGKDNKICRLCQKIKPIDNFRNNRLKCKHCLRDIPLDKLKRNIRSRIWIALKNKENHTIHYLGCDTNSYFEWLLSYNENYTIENRGKEWHIDHVIPLSRFDLDDKDEQLLAFNWRNTMPLSAKENLSKGNNIDKTQIEQHYNHLLEYHKNQNIEIPKEFVELFAKHLDAGIPLEPVLSNK
jgi:hypothetical protein